MGDDALLSEVERQRKYLALLPADYAFPLFNARQALESQRRSGYKDTASASREIIDNAIEAGATRVDVVFETHSQQGGKAVKAVAFIDNGAGMLPEMARYALSWGGGTHFDDHALIGRFGFGLPNASINQARRVEVYSRISADESFTRAVLDIDSFQAFGVQVIPEPGPRELPGFVREYLKRNSLSVESGTVVVWVEPDRLTYRRAAYLKDHLVDDFGVTYRYLLAPRPAASSMLKVRLVVEGVDVQPVDPMFLLRGARLFKPEKDDGAILTLDQSLTVRYSIDPDSGEKHLRLVHDFSEPDASDSSVLGTFHVRIARFPVGFAEDKGRRKIETTDAHRRFDIRKSRRGMSFVRSGREVQTVDAFPRSPHDVASGLGRWPLLQGYAYHWGVEVRFQPDLDDVFGITNDKQGVRPIEDFWRVLVEAEIDAALHRENAWQRAMRKRKPPTPAERPDRPSPAEEAARTAGVATDQHIRVPEHSRVQARQIAEEQAQAMFRAGVAQSLGEARQAITRETRRKPYHITYEEKGNGAFFEPSWNGHQIAIEINKSHPFYEVLYGDLLEHPDTVRAKEALDLLLMALARTELIVDDPDKEIWLSSQRKFTWSPFLDAAIRTLMQRLDTGEESEGEDS